MSGRASRASLAAAALSLKIDVATADVVGELERNAIGAVLLKGPALVRALYRDGTLRAYGDIDLLVAPGDFASCQRGLERLGFREVLSQADFPQPLHGDTWRRPDGATVDLHRTLPGAQASPQTVWDALTGATETIRVAGADVRVLTGGGLALQVAVHAAHHGVSERRPVADLARAVDVFGDDVWEAAARLAVRIDAVDAFAVGIRMVPAGALIAERLALPPSVSAEARLRALSPPPVALGMGRLAATPGIRAKSVLVARKVFPSRRFMHHWSPLARRGRLGLVLAYAWRPLWALVHARRGYAAWRAVADRTNGDAPMDEAARRE